ncbi:hypothetical protein [Henriciella mobilis]|uniref:hypothetical protein n=1 Tax=Henriciella mobilis TaxID=2305467 RepID=UPI001313EB61|nr:hypothetical protein [Henriciella mobilis]
MFDARSSTQKGLGLGFGLGVTGLVAALFFGALYAPSLTGPGKSVVEAEASASTPSDSVLDSAFSDEATRTYIRKLRRTFPSAAADLETSIRRALRRDADEVELGLIVLQAGVKEIAGSVDRLARADVRYFDSIVDLSQAQLDALQRSGAPYCMGNDLMMFAGLSEQQLYRAIFDRVGHGAGLYEYALGVNGILLNAIQDARTSPKSYGPLTHDDQQSLQALGLALVTHPQIVMLLTTEGKTRSEMDSVLADTNFCSLTTDILDKVEALPAETRGRLWAEALYQVSSGRWRYTLYRYTGY